MPFFIALGMKITHKARLHNLGLLSIWGLRQQQELLQAIYGGDTLCKQAKS